MLGVNHLHATPATARGGLDQDRVADFAGDLAGALLVVGERAIGARDRGYARLDHGTDGGNLVAHQADGLGGGADEAETALLDLLGKVGVFRQEAVTGVNGVGVRYLGGTDDGRDVEVAVGGAVGPDADGFVGQADVHQVAVHA